MSDRLRLMGQVMRVGRQRPSLAICNGIRRAFTHRCASAAGFGREQAGAVCVSGRAALPSPNSPRMKRLNLFQAQTDMEEMTQLLTHAEASIAQLSQQRNELEAELSRRSSNLARKQEILRKVRPS